MKRKSAKKSSIPITAEIRPINPQAFHAGMKVLRYFNDPISKKRIADPINESTITNKTLIIMPEIRSLLRRFLRAASVSCTSSRRTDFISLSKPSIISLRNDN